MRGDSPKAIAARRARSARNRAEHPRNVAAFTERPKRASSPSSKKRSVPKGPKPAKVDDGKVSSSVVQSLFSSSRSAAGTMIHRACAASGFEEETRGNARRFSRAEWAGILAVCELGACRNNPSYDADSAELFRLVSTNMDGWVLMDALPSGKRPSNPRWCCDIGLELWLSGAEPVVIASVRRYHDRVDDAVRRKVW